MTATPTVPTKEELLWPTLQAAIDLGGSAALAELDAAVIEREHYPADVQDVLHLGGPKTELQYRLAWARTYLKNMGLLANSKRAVWSVTDAGQAATEDQIAPLYATFVTSSRKKDKADDNGASDLSVELDQVEAESESEWHEALLDRLLKMSPKAFEMLAQRLLRESGFTSVRVTGRSGDGGIDGFGVYKISLLSFPVFFQCKRYKGSVGSRDVRDFRGAMAGRGDKGLLITTGNFTSDARTEAKRDGVPPIDLIEGDELCELLKEYSIGVTTTERVVEDVKIEGDYFTSLEPK